MRTEWLRAEWLRPEQPERPAELMAQQEQQAKPARRA
jgi:hypothetical protein